LNVTDASRAPALTDALARVSSARNALLAVQRQKWGDQSNGFVSREILEEWAAALSKPMWAAFLMSVESSFTHAQFRMLARPHATRQGGGQ
jgi:hypothetical protein